MSDSAIQNSINWLMEELGNVMKDYNTSLEKDEIFEVRKKIKLRIREIEKELDRLKQQLE